MLPTTGGVLQQIKINFGSAKGSDGTEAPSDECQTHLPEIQVFFLLSKIIFYNKLKILLKNVLIN